MTELGNSVVIRVRAYCNTCFTLGCLILFALQGHALMTRHSGSANPCPVIDFDAGFNAWMAYAYGLPKGVTVEQKFGKPFGEYLNTQELS